MPETPQQKAGSLVINVHSVQHNLEFDHLDTQDGIDSTKEHTMSYTIHLSEIWKMLQAVTVDDGWKISGEEAASFKEAKSTVCHLLDCYILDLVKWRGRIANARSYKTMDSQFAHGLIQEKKDK